MPKSLVIGAIVAVIVLIAVMSWLNQRSLEQPEPASNAMGTEAPAPPPSAPQPRATTTPATAQGPVVVAATAPVWLQVSEKGGATLYSGTLQPGQTYTVPATATAPVLKTGKPEALKITVGSTVAAPVGPPATTVSNVSLLPADLLKGPGASAPAASPAPPAPAPRARSRAPAPTASTPPPAPVETAPTTNTGE
jgi:hypothetical protein